MTKIKTVLVCIISMFLIGGCTENNDACKMNEKNFEKIFDRIETQSEQGSYSLELLNEQPLSFKDVSEMFHVSEDDIEDYEVRTPLTRVSASEIAMFKVKDGHMEVLEKGIEAHVNYLKETWSDYLPEEYDIVLNYKTYQCGNYYFFVIAHDAEAIIQVIKIVRRFKYRLFYYLIGYVTI